MKRFIHRTRFGLLVLSIVLSMFIISLNSTVIAPAMTIIATELDAVESMTWIATAYLVVMNAFQALAGKFSDVFGRKPIVLFGSLMFVGGSVVNAVSPTINGLIAGRAIQGCGAGGIISMLFVIVTDVVPLRLRPRFQSMLTVVYGLSSVVGPLIGKYSGVFVDKLTWRFDFWINVIIGGIATIILATLFKEPAKIAKSSLWSKIKRIDWLGTVFSVGFTCCLLLALNWGNSYGWTDAHCIGPFVAAAVSLVGLIATEGWLAHEPLMPREVVLNPAIVIVYLYMMALGLSFIGTLYFGPILFQAVFGASSTESGVRLIPYMVLLIAGSVSSSYLVERFSHLKYYLVIASAANLLGYGLFYTVNETSGFGKQVGFLTFCGLGFGMSQQNAILIVQQIAAKEHIAVATSLLNFFMMLASSVGIAIFQMLYLLFLKSNFAKLSPELLAIAQKYGALSNYLYIRDMPVEVQAPIIKCYMESLHTVFVVPLAAAGVGFLTTLFIRDVTFGGKAAHHNTTDDEASIKAESTQDQQKALDYTQQSKGV
ncbi:major facilitator superfamily domain-containing protein [Dichotomocladium elegans]|nr:major facilitator superfamily domain-containing protein [Dichotomocladium elegans]